MKPPNKELNLTKPGTIGASQLNFSVRPTSSGSKRDAMTQACLPTALLVAFLSSSPAASLAPPPALLVAPRGAQQDSALAGRWVANLEKSKRHANHQFKSSALEVFVIGDTVTLTYGGVNAGGESESGKVAFEADGEQHPIPEQPDILVVAEWSTPRRLDIVATREGATVGKSSYEVSPDGKTLTATVSGVDASGAAFEQVIVYDRE